MIKILLVRPKIRFIEATQAMGITFEDMANACRLPISEVESYHRLSGEIPRPFAEDVCRRFKVSLLYLNTGEGDVRRIQSLSRSDAGHERYQSDKTRELVDIL